MRLESKHDELHTELNSEDPEGLAYREGCRNEYA
jgi:hypothetical protein